MEGRQDQLENEKQGVGGRSQVAAVEGCLKLGSTASTTEVSFSTERDQQRKSRVCARERRGSVGRCASSYQLPREVEQLNQLLLASPSTNNGQALLWN